MWGGIGGRRVREELARHQGHMMVVCVESWHPRLAARLWHPRRAPHTQPRWFQSTASTRTAWLSRMTLSPLSGSSSSHPLARGKQAAKQSAVSTVCFWCVDRWCGRVGYTSVASLKCTRGIFAPQGKCELAGMLHLQKPRQPWTNIRPPLPRKLDLHVMCPNLSPSC